MGKPVNVFSLTEVMTLRARRGGKIRIVVSGILISVVIVVDAGATKNFDKFADVSFERE